MKRFLLKISIMFVPLACFIIFIGLFEVNNYFGIYKERTLEDHLISRMKAFERDPQKTILLGDSRFARFTRKGCEKVEIEQKITNMAFGGATIYESMELFWWAAEREKIEKVIFGLSYYNFNNIYTNTTFARYKKLNNNTIAYLFSSECIKGAYNNFKSKAFPSPEPQVNYKEYADLIYSVCEKYKLNDDAIEELKEIVEYCDNNGIEIIFVTPPMHKSIWENVITPLDLYDEMEDYKNQLSQMATLYDFEQADNEISSKYGEDFTDGFHFGVSSKGLFEYKKQIYQLCGLI